MLNHDTPSVGGQDASPDFLGLVDFLVKPFLDEPASLVVDCEEIESTKKIWIRVAFSGTDKGKVFGRGGRNLQAIRTVLGVTGNLVGKSVHFEVYGSQEGKSSSEMGTAERFRSRDHNGEDRRPLRRDRDSRPQKKERFPSD
jgi:uncharacterized protein